MLNQESDITKEELNRASLERSDSVQTLKFPGIDSDYYKRLVTLNPSKLDDLSLELLDMQGIQELDAFFSKNS